MGWWAWLFGGLPQRQLDRIERKLEHIMATNAEMKVILDDIVAKVAAVSAEVVDLIARLTAGGVDPALIAQAQGIADSLSAIPPEPAA